MCIYAHMHTYDTYTHEYEHETAQEKLTGDTKKEMWSSGEMGGFTHTYTHVHTYIRTYMNVCVQETLTGDIQEEMRSSGEM